MTGTPRPPAFIRIPAILVLALLCLPPHAAPAAAGDYAERHILGFSPDGATFAFEQFGVQDGSGFPYADIFVIDTDMDRWVEGSPFRVLIHDDRAEQKRARRDAAAKAGNMLRERVISRPGRLLASNPPFELSADPHRVEVNVNPVAAAPPERWTFALEEFPATEHGCAAFTGETVKGFRLTARRDGHEPEVLHETSAVPNSRGCPLQYGISDVLVHEPQGAARVFAVLLGVMQLGFEGPDRRFLAVTYRAP